MAPRVLDLCPRATLVTNWFSIERMACDYLLPWDRMRWVNEEERFPAGDREFVTVVPPAFDSPTTRGLYDTATGVYRGADSFACCMPSSITLVASTCWPLSTSKRLMCGCRLWSS